APRAVRRVAHASALPLGPRRAAADLSAGPASAARGRRTLHEEQRALVRPDELPARRAPQVLDQVAARADRRRAQDQHGADALEELAAQRRVAEDRGAVREVEVAAVHAVARVHRREEPAGAAPRDDAAELVLAEDAALVAALQERVDGAEGEVPAPAQPGLAQLPGAHREA